MKLISTDGLSVLNKRLVHTCLDRIDTVDRKQFDEKIMLINLLITIMITFKDKSQWVFYVDKISSKMSFIEDQWKILKSHILQELNLLGKVPIGFSCALTPEMKDYLDGLND